MEDRDRAYLERIEKKQGRPDYFHMWPIALAPTIPLVGLAFKNYPRTRNVLIAMIGSGVLFGAHGAAVSTSTFSK